MTPPIRILVTDDHSILRAGLAALLNAEPDLTVVGEASDGAECLRVAQAVQPDVILLDINMPGMNGLEALPMLRQLAPQSRVLVLTMHDDTTYLRQVLAAGGAGYVLKQAADKELLSAIRTVYSGGTFLHPAHAQSLLTASTPVVSPNETDKRITQLSEARSDLSSALKSRTVIDMAVGAIMAENRCTRDTAFNILTKASSTRNVKLREVAASVIASISGEKEIDTYFDE